MPVTLKEAKNYLRLDYDLKDDDKLIKTLLETAERLCLDIARCSEEELYNSELSRTAVLYAVGYLYEHREEANHNDLNLTLRALLFSLREGII